MRIKYHQFRTFLIQYLEYKIVNDQKLKLKDKYSHNLGNTLHSIYISVDLLKEKEVDQKDKKILIDMLEDKKKESNDLIKEIREL
ncbi:MAG: hypothetical protein BAJALOKI2v1_360013 [Promethearchaeota archaeon]|nr:MAG: hypothetical protein BAJALOKI2v1_360013 [Candidatus Lokiarchaeota archaeon]